MFLQSMNTEMVSSQGTSLDQAIKLSSTYFDDKSKTSKLLILISDGEDHSEGAQAAAEEANRGMRIITIGLGTEKEELFL
jgi:Ca-activated chloride channel family protein